MYETCVLLWWCWCLRFYSCFLSNSFISGWVYKNIRKFCPHSDLGKQPFSGSIYTFLWVFMCPPALCSPSLNNCMFKCWAPQCLPWECSDLRTEQTFAYLRSSLSLATRILHTFLFNGNLQTSFLYPFVYFLDHKVNLKLQIIIFGEHQYLLFCNVYLGCNSYNIKFTILNWCISISTGFQYTHNIVQLSPIYNSRIFKSLQKELLYLLAVTFPTSYKH